MLLTSVATNISQDVRLCMLVNRSQRFLRNYCLHLRGPIKWHDVTPHQTVVGLVVALFYKLIFLRLWPFFFFLRTSIGTRYFYNQSEINLFLPFNAYKFSLIKGKLIYNAQNFQNFAPDGSTKQGYCCVQIALWGAVYLQIIYLTGSVSQLATGEERGVAMLTHVNHWTPPMWYGPPIFRFPPTAFCIIYV
jgi:hypothetical protein